MKRALYSIPVVGLALTGCGNTDLIVDTWSVDTAFSRANPFSGQGIDIGGGTICDVDVSFGDLTIDEEYTGQMTYDLSLSNCNDPARDGTFNYVYDASVQVVAPNASYRIILVDSVLIQFTTTMECELTETTLDCNDDNLQSWVFNKVE